MMDPNYYEELIDQMMIDEVSGIDEEIKETLLGLDDSKKRLGILSILDKNRDLFMKIKKLIDNSDITKTEYIKEVVEMLREYVVVGDVEKKKFGEVMTPISLVEDMLDMLPEEVWSNPKLKWLDPCSGVGIFSAVIVNRLMKGLEGIVDGEENRYRHIMEKMLYVGELQPKNMFLFLTAFDPEDLYNLNIFTGDYLSEEFDNYKSEQWGVDKFDVVVMNPPYLRNKHLDFVYKSFDLLNKTGECLVIHPGSWIFNETPGLKKIKEFREKINKYLLSIEFRDSKKCFDIDLAVPVSITYIKKNKLAKNILVNDPCVTHSCYEASSVNNITKHGESEVYLSIKNKIFNQLNESLKSNLNKKGNYYITMPTLIGGSSDIGNPNNLFYCFTYKKNAYVRTELDEKATRYFGFETHKEAENFLNYIKGYFARFAFSIAKFDRSLNPITLSTTPWLDFKEEWPDERLFEFFNLTSDEIEYVMNFIPKFYDD